MFEITGSDIANLDDADLRTLVFRLALAELRAQGLPLSSVTAGGNQDAPDGGLDVRVDCLSDIPAPDFVPRRMTGFQVKKPDMPASAIREEMRPEGLLRDVICELADASGAYVIVSAQGSVADKPLVERRKAMRDSLHDLPNAAQLYTDFYDRDRVAVWVNEYPGTSAWIRNRVGRPLSGWSAIGDWEGGGVRAAKSYLLDAKACLVDETSCKRERLTILEGITRLRTLLSASKKCVRLVGLSGLGKTRFVQALFEEVVGGNSLDPSLAVYTDYSEETDPTAREMARQLIAREQRAILVVDNCNPSTHFELARLCASETSKVSLITVEYDVGDGESEHTDVFRLESVSPELVTEWIKESFPDLSQIDRNRIGEFSDGNFRVARALAETLGKGETLGSLKSRELFERIFRQRNQPDQQLLQAAEDLSLLFSIDGEDVSEESELGRVGTIRNISARQLYEALVEMRRRGVVQARGRFRAILPQAIANPLAARALDRIAPSFFDKFCRILTPRMLISVSHRLGFLHDSLAAQGVVGRWLQVDGPFSDLITSDDNGFQIIANIAPVSPETVLARFERQHEALNYPQCISLTKTIAYDADLFDRAAILLARFAGSEDESNNLNSGRNTFSELFHIYLSGTQAPPEQRRSLIKRLAASDKDHLRNSAQIALAALFKCEHFISMASPEFGARSRDWGWQPKFNHDIENWFQEAIALAIELLPDADARILLAKNARCLWRYPACQDALDLATTAFIENRPWVEGWIAFRATLRYDGKNMPDGTRAKLEKLIDRVKPSDPLNQARAIVLNRMNDGWDFLDGEERENDFVRGWEKANEAARASGRVLATEDAIRATFLTELLLERHAQRASEFGCGLAESARDLGTLWRELVTAFKVTEPDTRNSTVLRGFLIQAHLRDRNFSSSSLEAAIDDPDLAPILPYLQACVGIDVEGITRLRRAIAKGVLAAANFYAIANGSVVKSPPGPLAALLQDIATLPDGVEIAIDILHMHFPQEQDEQNGQNEDLLLVGRDLLVRADFSKTAQLRDFATHNVIQICLVDEDGQGAAKIICSNICSALDSYEVSLHNLTYTLKALVKTQPFIVLDAFLLQPSFLRYRHLFDPDLGTANMIDEVAPTVLEQWADRDPNARYPLLGKYLSMFGHKNDKEGKDLSPLFLSILAHAPDKQLFLGDFRDRLQPRSWGGSLADILIRRKTLVMELAEGGDERVRAWVTDGMPELDRRIERERESDRAREETFE